MSSFIIKFPVVWGESGEVVKPNDLKIALGWVGDPVPEQPPNEWFNWIDNAEMVLINELCDHANVYSLQMSNVMAYAGVPVADWDDPGQPNLELMESIFLSGAITDAGISDLSVSKLTYGLIDIFDPLNEYRWLQDPIDGLRFLKYVPGPGALLYLNTIDFEQVFITDAAETEWSRLSRQLLRIRNDGDNQSTEIGNGFFSIDHGSNQVSINDAFWFITSGGYTYSTVVPGTFLASNGEFKFTEYEWDNIHMENDAINRTFDMNILAGLHYEHLTLGYTMDLNDFEMRFEDTTNIYNSTKASSNEITRFIGATKYRSFYHSQYFYVDEYNSTTTKEIETQIKSQGVQFYQSSNFNFDTDYANYKIRKIRFKVPVTDTFAATAGTDSKWTSSVIVTPIPSSVPLQSIQNIVANWENSGGTIKTKINSPCTIIDWTTAGGFWNLTIVLDGPETNASVDNAPDPGGSTIGVDLTLEIDASTINTLP